MNFGSGGFNGLGGFGNSGNSTNFNAFGNSGGSTNFNAFGGSGGSNGLSPSVSLFLNKKFTPSAFEGTKFTPSVSLDRSLFRVPELRTGAYFFEVSQNSRLSASVKTQSVSTTEPVKTYEQPSAPKKAVDFVFSHVTSAAKGAARDYVYDCLGLGSANAVASFYSSGWGILFWGGGLATDDYFLKDGARPNQQKEPSFHVMEDTSKLPHVERFPGDLDYSSKTCVIIDMANDRQIFKKHPKADSFACRSFDTSLRDHRLRRTDGGDPELESRLFKREGDYLSVFIRETLRPQYSTSGARCIAEMKLLYGLPLTQDDWAALLSADVLNKEW